MKYFIFFFLILISGLSSSEPYSAKENTKEVQTFWKLFREAIIKKDWTTVELMNPEPITVKGQTDSYPNQKIKKGMLGKHFSKKIFIGTGKPEQTLSELINKTQFISKEHFISDSQFRVYNLLFIKDSNSWRLATIYNEDE